ncbi:MAG TPA: bifunctional phosphopantothenoylcysteine decarboxylase/phosphopantothenate--cysteine ligase CoaBC, partial [Actinomycetota bacterium]|nr:bifunctional phosphopantothenoylcysteine decarboxylase/phosphopantothenate--cysteine ligase CoaBC [Actinomycetota bacterium]
MAQPGRAPLAGARVLLGVTGGIAAYKAAELARELMRAGAEVQPMLTESGERMVSRATFAALTGRRVPASVWDDPAGVEHVALARWGQVLVVAPATAHTLARLAAGLADDLLTNVALAFGGPVVVAPAMHTEMWEHPATQASLQTLEARGVRVVPPASGPLTSGDVGPGRLAELDDLIAGVTAALAPSEAGGLAGTRVLVSLGGTREPLDPVRYLGNRSSGRMGAAIVAEALRRGAEVTAVAAATAVDPPAGARLVRVETAQQLYDAVLAEAGTQDVLIMAAAVADFRPKRVAEGKLKKDQGVPEVVLEPTPDTLAELGRRRRPDQVLVGFAAETGDHLAGARRKLEAKHLDLVVLNHVEGANSAFGADDADAYLVDA